MARLLKAKRPAGRRSGNGAIRTYRAALAFINSMTDYEKMRRVGYNHTNFNLSRMNRLLKALGNPHKAIRSVHIAGTKGKGSTAAMLANMLKACGYTVGLYTSPHLIDLRERIMVNGRMITEPEMTRLVARVAPAVTRMIKDSPTFFEIMTTIAFMHFVNRKVDIAVIETGLGGRLDSTNVLRPEACGITSISEDHQEQLGGTLAQIAQEKAGIFKAGVPIISAPQPQEVKNVLRREAAKTRAPLRFTGEDIEFSYRFESSRVTGPHTRVCLTTPTSRYEHLAVPLLGEHQAINCGVALGLLDALKSRGFAINDQEAMQGLAKVVLPGRMEIISEDPRILVDGAHNPASIEALMRAIGQNIPYDSMVVVFGCSADKNIPGMLHWVALGADKVIFTVNGSPRTADPFELHNMYVEGTGKMAQATLDIGEALRIASNAVTREDLICVTGSFYLVGHVKRLLARSQT
jgi:dihydrofolate synthase/folylpolyglutamate synthase